MSRNIQITEYSYILHSFIGEMNISIEDYNKLKEDESYFNELYKQNIVNYSSYSRPDFDCSEFHSVKYDYEITGDNNSESVYLNRTLKKEQLDKFHSFTDSNEKYDYLFSLLEIEQIISLLNLFIISRELIDYVIYYCSNTQIKTIFLAYRRNYKLTSEECKKLINDTMLNEDEEETAIVQPKKVQTNLKKIYIRKYAYVLHSYPASIEVSNEDFIKLQNDNSYINELYKNNEVIYEGYSNPDLDIEKFDSVEFDFIEE